MDGQGKLARTPSSLLRSPALRSCVQSLTAVEEEGETLHSLDENRKTYKPVSSSRRRAPPLLSYLFTSSGCSYCIVASIIVAVTSLSLFGFLYFVLFYLTSDMPGVWKFLLISALIGVAYLLARRCASLKLRSRRDLSRGEESVEWYIGEEVPKKEKGSGRGGSKFASEGVEFYSNGDYYEGEFHKGKCNGSGVYNYFGNGRYEGEWVDGRYEGYGIEAWARGSRYRGQYRLGLRHGFGVYRFYTGDSYAGEWLNGQSHGVGVQTCSDGSCYVGEFRCGIKHGLGYYRFRNGDRYSGEYFNDKIHGFGVYHFVNGHCYEGSWHEGRRQGYGTYTFRNSDARSGEWDCGILKNPHSPSSPAVQRSVSAARASAENASVVPRVDEQVDKAVAAANRAATAGRVAAVRAAQNRMDGKFCGMGV